MLLHSKERLIAVKFSKFMLICALTAGMSFAGLTGPVKAADNTVQEALKAFKQKNYTKANTLIDQHLSKNPQDANAQYAKAMILYHMGYYLKALQRLETVLKLSPHNHNAAASYAAITQKAVYHLNQGKNEEAIALAEKSIEVMPKFDQREFRVALSGCYYAKGIAYFERWCLTNNPEDSNKAMEAWEKTRELEPTSATQQLVNGINAFLTGNYASAKKYFDEGLSVRANNEYLQLWQGFANASVGEYRLALSELNELTSLFPRNPVLHLFKGDINKVLGDYSTAGQEYITAQELRPTDHRIDTAIKMLYLCANQVDDGFNHYTALISQNPQDFNPYYQLAGLQFEAGRYSDALASYKTAASMPGANPVQAAAARMQAALIHLQLGDAKAAAACINPEDLQLLQNSASPLALLYTAYTDTQPSTREKACRDSLLYAGPDSIFIHSAAFKAWANLENERKQPLRAMEYIYQAWRRTYSHSEMCNTLRSQFSDAKQNAYAQFTAKEHKLTKGKNSAEKVQEIQNQISILDGINLGEPGGLLYQAQVSTDTEHASLIPKELTSNIPLSASTSVTASSWVNITPDWQQ